MTNTFFLLLESPIYTRSQLPAERYLSQPAMLKSQSVQKMLRPRTCTVTSLWLNVYILCSEQKNASQKPSVVVYNIGCQKGFIQLEVLEMYKITVAYIHYINISREVTNRTSILLDPFIRLCMFAIYYIFVNNTHPIKQLASITFFSV